MNSVDCPTVFEGAERGSRVSRFNVACRTVVGRALPALVLVVCAPLVAVGTAALSSGTASAETPCSGTVGGMTIFGGSNQVTKVGTAFATSLQVEVVATNGGCPLAGVDVTLGAPATGASASFAGGVIAVTVATGTNGIATAPTLTANDVSGSFSVEATVSTFSVSFELTNTTVGAASSVSASSGGGQSAQIGEGFGEPLGVVVTDAFGDPVAGATIDFTVVTTDGAGATFSGGGAAATAQTDSTGAATSPALTAGDTPGAFTVTATVAGTSLVATFSLTNLAGSPSAVTAGVGTSQSAELGTDFAIPLVVTVTDANSNDLAGVAVTFHAPAGGASGVFAGSGIDATVLTNSSGVATAPDFSANQRTGGYVVIASVAGVATPATFALVNDTRTTATAPGPAGSYWLVTSKGRVMSSGSAANYGSAPPKKLAGSVVGMATAPRGEGYWVVTSKGAVYRFGAVGTYSPAAGLHLGKPVVGMAATPDGKGYWLVTSNGAVLPYGDAVAYGSAAGLRLSKPVVGIVATPDGKGYWLVASDGGVFRYGDAVLSGSAARLHLRSPVVGMAASADGRGYWLVTGNGAVYAYGDATVYGSGTGLSPRPVKAIVATTSGDGYWLVSADGTVAGFGDGGAQGSPMVGAKTVVGGAA